MKQSRNTWPPCVREAHPRFTSRPASSQAACTGLLPFSSLAIAAKNADCKAATHCSARLSRPKSVSSLVTPLPASAPASDPNEWMGLFHSFLSACHSSPPAPTAAELKEGISHPYPLAPLVHGRPPSAMRESPTSSSTSASTWPARKRSRSASVTPPRPIIRTSEGGDRDAKRARQSLDTRTFRDAPHTASPTEVDNCNTPAPRPRRPPHTMERSCPSRQPVCTMAMTSTAPSHGTRSRRKLHKTRMVEGDWDLIRPCDLTDPTPRFSLSLGLGGSSESPLASYSRLGSH